MEWVCQYCPEESEWKPDPYTEDNFKNYLPKLQPLNKRSRGIMVNQSSSYSKKITVVLKYHCKETFVQRPQNHSKKYQNCSHSIKDQGKRALKITGRYPLEYDFKKNMSRPIKKNQIRGSIFNSLCKYIRNYVKQCREDSKQKSINLLIQHFP